MHFLISKLNRVVLITFTLIITLSYINFFYIKDFQLLDKSPSNHKNGSSSDIKLPLPPLCTMDNCFNYSKCTLFEPIQFYIWDNNENTRASKQFSNLSKHRKRTVNLDNACFIILYLHCESEFSRVELELKKLSNQDTNVIVLIDCNKLKFNSELIILIRNKFASFIIVSNVVIHSGFRSNYDIAIPDVGSHVKNAEKFKDCKQLAFLDWHLPMPPKILDQISEVDDSNISIEQYNFGILYFDSENYESSNVSWKYEILYQRLMTYLTNGIVPVLITPESTLLPLNELINWNQICLRLSLQRAAQVYEILFQVSDQVIQNYVYNGRVAYNTYLRNSETLVNSVWLVLETRLDLPGILYKKDFNSESKSNVIVSDLIPNRKWFQSLLDFPEKLNKKYFKTESNDQNLKWFQSLPPPWILTQNVENNVELFQKEKQTCSIASSFEKYTILILTYKRTDDLLKILLHLDGLENLDKILVVWNYPILPGTDIRWPNISAPIEIVPTKRNSLNNRFYPYSQIQTDGILSLDDDVWIEKENIEFAFRVWKANRNKLVGFPDRGITWNPTDNKWTYGNNEKYVSMILTGATFVHKYYYYYYTFEMDEEIRDLIDKFINCEDIAMNFLVSHLSQEPNIKVTKQIEFDCKTCGKKATSLWLDPQHFKERNHCINFLEKAYGYIPLQNTVFRADDFNS